MDYNKAYDYAVRILKRMPEKLVYHNLVHTVKNVLPAVILFSSNEGITNFELKLLKTAALYHDLGYIKQSINHEDISIRIAKKYLPKFNYSEHDINIICNAIKATKLPQNPKNKIEKILCDADLDTLGRNDFFVYDQLVRLELINITNKELPLNIWFKNTLEFLENHHYFTNIAKKLRQRQKEKNMENIRKLINTT